MLKMITAYEWFLYVGLAELVLGAPDAIAAATAGAIAVCYVTMNKLKLALVAN